MVRMLAQDCRHSQRLGAGPGSPGGGFGFDLVDQVEGPCSPGVGGKMLPAGEGREGHRLAGRILEAIELLSPLPGGILQSPAEPVPLDRIAFGQGSSGMEARPLPGARHKSFFGTVAEDVLQSRDLRPLLSADEDRLVTPRPDSIAPIDEPAHLPREVGVEIAHEARELVGVVDVEQQVIMGGDKYERADPDVVQPLGSPEDAGDDLVDLPTGTEEVAALHGPAGDLDQGSAFGDEAKSSAHAQIRRKIGPQSSSP